MCVINRLEKLRIIWYSYRFSNWCHQIQEFLFRRTSREKSIFAAFVDFANDLQINFPINIFVFKHKNSFSLERLFTNVCLWQLIATLRFKHVSMSQKCFFLKLCLCISYCKQQKASVIWLNYARNIFSTINWPFMISEEMGVSIYFSLTMIVVNWKF